MGKTFDQSLVDVANIPMSAIDPDDMRDKTSEEFEGLRRVQQGCHLELTNREDFPFDVATKTIRTNSNQSLYPSVGGTIKEVWLQGEKSPMSYSTNIKMKIEASGKPKIFGVKQNPEKIQFYPTPDDSYNIEVTYKDTKNVQYEDGTYGYEIKVNSTLKMPERLQPLYFDALEYYVLATNMRKQSNPRWQPTLEIFNQRWQLFLDSCKSADAETIFVI